MTAISCPPATKPPCVDRPRLIAAPFTPLLPDGSVHYDSLAEYAANLSSSGVTGVFIGGTSGEGMSLTREERMRLAETWLAAAGQRLSVIVHVGHTCLEEAKGLAAHASSIGAHGIASIGSVFFDPSSPEAWVECCQIMAAAAPSTPFYYYHMPSMSRIREKASRLLPQMIKAIPSFAGIKFTHEDLGDYSECLRLADGRYEIFFGRDELLLTGLSLGAKSAVGSTYNFAAPLYHKTARLHALGRSSEAEEWQSLCTNAISIMIRLGGLNVIRSTMKLCGFDCGPMRLPLRAPDECVTDALRDELQGIAFFERLEQARAELLQP
ncbi:N-acetylneuraminate lyase [Terrimicrobium sacchariphilum]|uniref:N-acetylneuraminate lyase n=1 Tax=Terrimicrobium sacchariphilum TaxID=690879 RepID=A0A146GCA2_TERSA|nr:dihydrodipicolinate synthase family protein [Terrimicrobium sacchariphilum]GAT35205.1 N-acetylneuraminate lyase [Terrimicrobium sacchariphilum]